MVLVNRPGYKSGRYWWRIWLDNNKPLAYTEQLRIQSIQLSRRAFYQLLTSLLVWSLLY
jgi:hypothetical protein